MNDMKLSKKEKEKIHRQTLDMLGGPDRGATWIGIRPSVHQDKTPKRNKKIRRAENKRLCREALCY